MISTSQNMSASNKEQIIIFLALVIIYLGVYTLSSSEVPGGSASDAQWAGFFSITLGVFALLTLMFARPGLGAVGTTIVAVESRHTGLFLLVAVVALLGSAFFNYKLLSKGVRGNGLKYALWAQLVALVLLVITYFFDFDRTGVHVVPQLTGLNRSPYLTGAPGTGALGTPLTTGFGLTSPRLPVRAR